MDDDQKVRVGDVFLVNGKINKVFKLGKEKNLDGEVVPFVFFRPCFKEGRGNAIECSIPMANFGQLRQRKLVSKARVKELLDQLSKRVAQTELLEIEEAETIARQNRIGDKVGLIRRLWKEKSNKEKNFSYSKGVILNNILEDVCQEMAVVMDVTYEEVLKKVERKQAKAMKN